MQKASLHAATWVHEVAQRVYEMSPTTGQGKQSDRPASILSALSRASSKTSCAVVPLRFPRYLLHMRNFLVRAAIIIQSSPADPVTV